MSALEASNTCYSQPPWANCSSNDEEIETTMRVTMLSCQAIFFAVLDSTFLHIPKHHSKCPQASVPSILHSSKSPGSWPRHCTEPQCAGPSPRHRSSHVQLDPRDPVRMFLDAFRGISWQYLTIFKEPKHSKHSKQTKCNPLEWLNEHIYMFCQKWRPCFMHPPKKEKKSWTRSRLPGSAGYTSFPHYRSARPSVPAANHSRPGRLNLRSLGGARILVDLAHHSFWRGDHHYNPAKDGNIIHDCVVGCDFSFASVVVIWCFQSIWNVYARQLGSSSAGMEKMNPLTNHCHASMVKWMWYLEQSGGLDFVGWYSDFLLVALYWLIANPWAPTTLP